jgi:hypothetical protein
VLLCRRAPAVVLACLLLSGCGGSLGRMPLIGEPAGTPPPPDVRPEYPSVGSPRGGSRDGRPMSAAERAKLEAELGAARTGAAEERRKKITEPD